MINKNEIPALWPKRYYYGWGIVGAAMLISFIEVGEFNPVLSVFMKPLNDDLGWSRTEISGAVAFGSLVGGVFAPFAGRLIDRIGPRTVLIVAQLLLGCVLAAAGLVQELWQFYFTYNLGRAIVMGIMGIALGVLMANWFDRQRPMALGFTQLGVRIGMAILPLSAQLVIENFGWRWAFASLGIMVWVVGVVPSYLFLRQRPEDVGLLADGRVEETRPAAIAPGVAVWPVYHEQESWTLDEARKTRAMWLMTIATSFGSVVGAGFNLHMVPFFLDQGISSMVAVGAGTVIAVSGGAGGLFWGWIASRISPRHTVSLLSFLGGACIFSMLFVHNQLGVYAVVLVYGLAFGGWGPLAGSLWADYFGRRHLGTITGSVAPIRLAANASGPLLGGVLYDYFGNYEVAFTIYAASYVMMGFLILLARPPERRPVQGQLASAG